jgi:tetratricopeptide (TPR) repeat protein
MKTRSIIFMAVMMFAAAVLTAAETYKEAWEKGIKEYKARKYKDSLATLSEAVELAKTPAEKYNSMCYKGYSLRNLRKHAESVKVFDELMKVDGLSAKQKDGAFGQYLHSIYYSGKNQDVISIAEKTVADDKASNSMKTVSAYLACLSSSRMRKNDDKIKWAKKLQELNPKGYWHNRGLIYQAQALRAQKKYKEAEELLSKENIAKMHPHRQGEAYLERGHIKADQKKYDEAVIEYTAVYELPKGHPGHKEMAVVYAIERLDSAGKPEEAQVWIERIDTIKNKYWKTRGLMRHAQLLQKQGKLKEAKEKWEECKKSGPWWKKIADKQIAVINKKLEAK